MLTKREFDLQCITYSQMNLIFNARIYYRRLTTWTRAYLLSKYFGIGNADEIFGRLYLESLNIGNLIQIIFGREYAEEYSRLLSQYAITLRELIDAQLEGDDAGVVRNVDLLYENVAKRAAFLEELNPYESEEEYKKLLDAYTRYIIEEANALASGNYSEDIKLYDLMTAHTNQMGDLFAEALYDYNTSCTVNAGHQCEKCVTYDQMNAIYQLRMFWFEFVTWVRNYMLSRYLGLGNSEEVYVRLKQVLVDVADAMKKIFGDQFQDAALLLLNNYVNLIDGLITASMDGNYNEVDRITRFLYLNAEEIAELSAINPYWSKDEWRDRFYSTLHSTLRESSSLLAGDYIISTDIFSRLLDQAESDSNYVAKGLFDYINSEAYQQQT